MTRPPSIARFELFYVAAVVIGLVNTALNWNASQARLAANPMLANAGWFLPLTQVIGLTIAALLWYFIVRRPSVVAKWIQVVFAAFGAFGLLSALFLLATARTPFAAQIAIGLVGNIFYIVAAVMLFKPDSKAWFGEGLGDEDDLDLKRP